MRPPSVLVTGCSGGIGQSICECFQVEGLNVIGVDLDSPSGFVNEFLHLDLLTLTSDRTHGDFTSTVEAVLGEGELIGIVNNAALQVVSPIDKMSIDQLTKSLQVNCIAAFGVIKALLEPLIKSRGTVINIGSIHARLTKPNFLAYATSKAALEGMTRALAVELGAKLRVCGISPAAIETDMLRRGFADDEGALQQLAACHPTQTLGTPEEIARVALLLLKENLPFANGTIIEIDGGVGSLLHDP